MNKLSIYIFWAGYFALYGLAILVLLVVLCFRREVTGDDEVLEEYVEMIKKAHGEIG